MGMYASYRRLSPEEFQHLYDDPEAADVYFGLNLCVDDEEDETEELADAVDAYYHALQTSGRYLEIKKSFCALHFLLTGTTDYDDALPPLRNVVAGGHRTEWEAGYGNFYFLTPEEVKETAAALEELTEEELRQRYDPAAFLAEDIYPGGECWQHPGNVDYLLGIFRNVRDFFCEAARQGEVIFMGVS